VFRLVRLLISLAMLGGFVWFGMTVKLGDKTLFEHIAAIGKSKETKDLVEGTKEAAKPVIHKVEEKLSKDGGASEAHGTADRKALKREIKKHLQ
jgi:hypothetical protein